MKKPDDDVMYQVNVFSDAADDAFAAVVHICRIVNGIVSVFVVFGKSRVALGIKNLLKLEIQSVPLGNFRVGLVAGRVYFDELITQIILKTDWIAPRTQEVSVIRVEFIKYNENLLKLEI